MARIEGGISVERLTVFDGEFWLHKDFPPVREDTVSGKDEREG